MHASQRSPSPSLPFPPLCRLLVRSAKAIVIRGEMPKEFYAHFCLEHFFRTTGQAVIEISGSHERGRLFNAHRLPSTKRYFSYAGMLIQKSRIGQNGMKCYKLSRLYVGMKNNFVTFLDTMVRIDLRPNDVLRYQKSVQPRLNEVKASMDEAELQAHLRKNYSWLWSKLVQCEYFQWSDFFLQNAFQLFPKDWRQLKRIYELAELGVADSKAMRSRRWYVSPEDATEFMMKLKSLNVNLTSRTLMEYYGLHRCDVGNYIMVKKMMHGEIDEREHISVAVYDTIMRREDAHGDTIHLKSSILQGVRAAFPDLRGLTLQKLNDAIANYANNERHMIEFNHDTSSNYIYTSTNEFAAESIVNYLRTIQQNCRQKRRKIADADEIAVPEGLQCNAEQRQAIVDVFRQSLTLLTGLGGTGKTHVLTAVTGTSDCVLVVSFVNRLLDVLRTRTKAFSDNVYGVEALIGAYKRIQRAAESEAVNISREDRCFKAVVDRCEILIADEASNLDMLRVFRMLRAVLEIKSLAPQTKGSRTLKRLLFVFDEHQLEPINAGQPAMDMLNAYGSTRLKTTMRLRTATEKLVNFRNMLVKYMDMEIEASGIDYSFETSLTPCTRFFQDSLAFVPVNRIGAELPEIYKQYGSRSVMCIVLENKDIDYINQIADQTFNIRRGGNNAAHNPHVIRLYNGMRFAFNINRPERSVSKLRLTQSRVNNSQVHVLRRVIRVRDGVSISKDRAKNFNEVLADDELLHELDAEILTDHDLYTDVENQRKLTILETAKGKYFVIGRKNIHPRNFMLGYSGSSVKVQGDESDYAVIYLPDARCENAVWNVKHLYVMVTRARRAVRIYADPEDFALLLRRPWPRRTLLSHMLTHKFGSFGTITKCI